MRQLGYFALAFVIFLSVITPIVLAQASENSGTGQQMYGNTPKEYEPFGDFVQEPYKRFFIDPREMEYTGPGREKPEPEHVDAVKVGFLGPLMPMVSVATGGMSNEHRYGIKMMQGCLLAFEQANAHGGYEGKIPYKLLVRNDNGLWGASGDEIIRFAYDEHCWAFIGTIDGANSHIAIRVALKCEIPVMNTGDTDPTFVETKIPWVFRCITDDRQMCYLLADYVVKKLGKRRIAAIRQGDRYGRMSIDEFRDGVRRLGYPLITELQFPPAAKDFTIQLDRVQAMNPDAIITYANSEPSSLLLKQMRDRGMDQLFIGSDRMVTQDFINTVGEQAGEVIAGYPFDPTRDDPKFLQFQEDFRARFGEEPEQYAAHAYDGACIVIEAIEHAGLNRAKIRDYMAKMGTYRGVTGEIRFDDAFNDVSPGTLAILENGEWNFYTRNELDIPSAVPKTTLAK